MSKHNIETQPIHLGLGATALAEPAFTGDLSWYEDYINRHVSDGAEGRLVSFYRFSGNWEMWEMHPHGAETVICTEGEMILFQEAPDKTVSQIALAKGEYAINPPGIWHTADIDGQAAAIFITAGLGTEHRLR